MRKPEVKESDLNALAERAADLVGHQMKLKQVTISLKLDPTLPRVPADEGQLRQALLALLMNALDATPSGGRVEIETRREGSDSVSLTVADSGMGIPRENLDKIFSPFFTTKPVGRAPPRPDLPRHRVRARRADARGERGRQGQPVVAGALRSPGKEDLTPMSDTTPIRMLVLEDDKALPKSCATSSRPRPHGVAPSRSARAGSCQQSDSRSPSST